MSDSNRNSFGAILGIVASLIAVWGFVTGWADVRTTWRKLAPKGVSQPSSKSSVRSDAPTPNVSTRLMRVTTGPNRETLLHFTLPASEEGRTIAITTQFALPPDKGLLGSSANSGSQAGFMNAEMTIFAVNHQPYTKTSYVYLFLRSPNGLQMLQDVNGRIAAIIPPEWRASASGFLRVEHIIGRELFLQAVEFTPPGRRALQFSVTVDTNGGLRFINASYEGPTK